MSSLGRVLVVAGMICLVASSSAAQEKPLPAFPGAEGYGAVAVGGRGGRVIKVTNLKASGPGSFRWAAAQKGRRILVFDVSGVIRGHVLIRDNHCTIAGQTAPAAPVGRGGRREFAPGKLSRLAGHSSPRDAAPGAGITLEGMLLSKYPNGADDLIIRFLRVRPRHSRGHTGDGIQMPRSDRVILDHCSVSWSVDELVDCIGAADWTMQWCTLEEADTVGHDKGRLHNYGFCSAYAGSGRLSIHHNLFAHLSRRAPCVAPYLENAPADVRNNVIYNVQRAFTHSGHGPKTKSPVNLIGNWYRHGPNADRLYAFCTDSQPQYYIADNYVHKLGYIPDPVTPGAKFPRWFRTNPRGRRLKKAAPVAPVATQKAEEAYKLVIARAGCFPRDRVTKRTINEVQTGTGKWGRNAPAAPSDAWFLKGLTVGKPPADADKDGMPDDWETAHRLDPNDPSDANRIVPKGASPKDRHKGYTWIEYYINDRADQLLAAR